MSAMLCNSVFKELLLEGHLCDIAIRVHDAEFKAHSIVLCGCSSYFRDLFCMKRSSSEPQFYSFPEVTPTIMSLILEYAYTGSVVVTEGNVLDLLAGADSFTVKGIMQVCWNFLEQQLCLKNSVDMWILADFHKCPDMKQKAYLYILEHFEEVVESCVKFLELSVQQLSDFIEKDQLNVRQESAVFEAILRWIDYAPEERSSHMATLLSKVRLLLMSSKYLVDTVSKNALVRTSLASMTMVINAMKTLRESNLKRPLTRTRLPSALLLAIGGWENNSPTNRIDLYNARTEQWVRVNHNGEALRAFHGCIFLDGFVYCIGGFDSVNYLSSVQKFNLATKTWQEVGSMHIARCYVTVVTLNGCIYAIGGSDGHDKLNTAERYQSDTNQWTLIAPMHEHRGIASAATLHGKVYVFGGFDGDEVLSSAECYNPHTNQWTFIAPMESGCSAAQAVAYKDQIYVVGGYRGVWHLNRVIAYDPKSNRWNTMNPMMHRRSGFGMAVLEEQLYVAGGFNRHGTLRNVERYDEKADQWHVVKHLDTPRSGFSCCVVQRNAATYLL